MYFKQITTPGLGCLSYIIGCPGAKVCAVVDPKRDAQDYLDITREEGMRITHVIETHIHADHVSGNQELAAATGAEICYMEGSPITYPHTVLKEGDEMVLGNAKLRFLHTPGHTPHAMSILVTDTARADEPWLLLTGDLLFVGDVGRPDLAGEELFQEQAENLYRSLYHKLGYLPDRIEVFPAHGQGSLCGKGMSFKSNTTLGFERVANWAFQFTSKQAFLDQVLGEFPIRPMSFTHIITTNMNGAPLLERCPLEKSLSLESFKARMDAGAVVIDTRDTAAFGGVHIPASVNIGFDRQTANWVGMVVDPKAEIILVVEDKPQYDAMLLELHRIGYDNITGYLAGGISTWVFAGMPVEKLDQLPVQQLKDLIHRSDNGAPRIIDVRTPGEWEAGHLAEAQHLPLMQVLKEGIDAPRDEELIVICGSGYRSNIVASHLQENGYTEAKSVAGGMFAWANSGFPVTK
ncbi:MAG: MBL fold metallo-hydrolase [Desulfovibrio sp.]|nr:MAG: MBL fold metallo-hydrolase [Desulfovibrio sp.]